VALMGWNVDSKPRSLYCDRRSSSRLLFCRHCLIWARAESLQRACSIKTRTLPSSLIILQPLADTSSLRIFAST